MEPAEEDDSKSIRITSPLPSRLSAKMAGGGGPGTYLSIKASMKLASEESIRKNAIANADGKSIIGDHSFTLEPIGTLCVLVVDDQRTMRQMVSMIFQSFCKDYVDMRVEITTALCGEEAVRVSRQKHFHLITMDQTLSPGYCKSVLETQGNLRTERRLSEGGASDDALRSFDAAAMLNVDADRLQTAKRRTEFFKDELMHHLVKPPFGSSRGVSTSFFQVINISTARGVHLVLWVSTSFSLCLVCLLFSGSLESLRIRLISLLPLSLGPRRRWQRGWPRGDAHDS